MRCPHDSVSSDVCSLCQARHERLMADPMSKAERAAVVRYLRAQIPDADEYEYGAGSQLRRDIEAIERGEHLKPEPTP